jgi:hypothetical protein
MCKDMTIHVQQKHIDQGESRRSCFCPIALALADSFSDVIYASVGTGDFAVNRRGFNLLQSPLPESASKFVRAFDNGKPVKPFTFEIEIP